MVLHSMSNKVIGFEHLKDDYSSCPDFGIIFTDIFASQGKDHTNFLLCDGYLFKGVNLYIPRSSIRDFFDLGITCWRISRLFWSRKDYCFC